MRQHLILELMHAAPSALSPLPEQVVAPEPQPGVLMPQLLPPLPPPVVVADKNEEEVSHLSPLFIYFVIS